MRPNFRPTDAWRRARFLPVIFFFFFLIPFFSDFSFARSVSSDRPQSHHDQWSVIKIGGNTVGYLHEELRRVPARPPEIQDEILQTNSEMRVALNRLGSKIEISFNSFTDESPDGRLRAVQSEMMASNQTTKPEAIVNPGIIELRSEAGGKSNTRKAAKFSSSILLTV